MSRSATYTVIGPHVVMAGHIPASAATTASSSSARSASSRRTRKYAGEPTRLEIGDRNTIREFCTFNCGTAQDAGVTRLGDDNWIMAYVHLAHDCQVGNKTIFANNTQLAGHVHVGDWAILGGFTVRASVRAHRCPQLHGDGHHPPAGPAALRHGRRQSRRAAQHQCRRPQAARLFDAMPWPRSNAPSRPCTRAAWLDEARAAIEAERAAVPELALLHGFSRRARDAASSADGRIAMVAGEASSDQLAAHLIGALAQASARCEVLWHRRAEDAARGLRVALAGGDAGRARLCRSSAHYRASPACGDSCCAACWDRPDVFIGVDGYDFNLWLEKRLKRREFPPSISSAPRSGPGAGTGCKIISR
jgi:hypothetical protein